MSHSNGVRSAAGLFLVFTIACGPTSVAPAPPTETTGAENHTAAPEETVVPPALDEALAGRWSLTHGGMAWLELEITLHPALSAQVLSFDPSGGWTEFTIVRVKLGDSGALELTGQYTSFPQTVEIVLQMGAGSLSGTANGATYGAPEPVTGHRIR